MDPLVLNGAPAGAILVPSHKTLSNPNRIKGATPKGQTMKIALGITLAAGLLAASSFAFAGKNNDTGGRSGPFDNPAAAAPSDRFDPPDETTVKYCRAARIKDANCRNALSR